MDINTSYQPMDDSIQIPKPASMQHGQKTQTKNLLDIALSTKPGDQKTTGKTPDRIQKIDEQSEHESSNNGHMNLSRTEQIND